MVPKILFYFAVLTVVFGRKHRLALRNEGRSEFALTTFGFITPGYLYVNLSSLKFAPTQAVNISKQFGFTVDRADSAGISPYIEHREDESCIFLESDDKLSSSKTDIVTIVLDLPSESFKLSRHGSKIQELPFYKSLTDFNLHHSGEFISSLPQFIPAAVFDSQETSAGKQNSSDDAGSDQNELDYDAKTLNQLPLTKILNSQNEVEYGLQFVMYISQKQHMGLYNLFYHNCQNLDRSETKISFNVEIIEKNGGNYLTAFEIELPKIYVFFSAVYLICCVAWLTILRNAEKVAVFKVHYLMVLVVGFKSLSLLVHAMDYHFINLTGQSHNTWAVLYYVTYVIRGLLLFTVLMLIGSGWQLMKHVFSANEKRLFVLVLTLQVVTNVAYVLKENTEEGAERHEMWQQLFILVDLICCGAVLFPIVWSIRHLQEATRVDGKGTGNLVKLKLFRHFYMTIVCYIYFTRIVVYLLRILVNFQYRWLDAVSTELATLVFFVITAYTFRPNSTNPYIRLSQEDNSDCEDLDMQERSAEHGMEASETHSHHQGDWNYSPPTPGGALSGDSNLSENVRRKKQSSPRHASKRDQRTMQKSIV